MDEVRTVEAGAEREWHLYRNGKRVGRVWRDGPEWRAERDDGGAFLWQRFEFRDTALMALQNSLKATGSTPRRLRPKGSAITPARGRRRTAAASALR